MKLRLLAVIPLFCRAAMAQSGVYPPPIPSRQIVPKTVCMLGDSRAAQLNVQTGFIQSISGYQPFNVANALMGHQLILTGNYGISGNRSDQFVSANLPAMVSDTCEIAIINGGSVNNISQAGAGYTDVNGNVISLSNVARFAVADLIRAANALVAAGKYVIVISDPGSTSFATTGTVGAVLEFNQRMNEYTQSAKALWIDITPTVWAPASSASAIVWNTGLSYDGLHFNLYGAHKVGIVLASFLLPLFPFIENRPVSIADTQATNPYQLIGNGLYTNLAGGSKTGAGTISGNVPLGFEVHAGAATTTVTVTSGTAAGGFGNYAQLAISTTAPDVIYFDFFVNSANYNIGDILQMSGDVTVASGANQCYVFASPQFNTSSGTPNVFDVGSFDGEGAMPNDAAYAYHMQTKPYKLPIADTKGYVIWRVQISMLATGNATVKFERPSLRRRFGM